MSKSITFNALEQITRIEAIRDSKVIVLAASHLEFDILPQLYEQLLNIGEVKRLDVILHGRGGVVNAARRIALLLRKFTKNLCFIVPYSCESSATILTLAADEIIAGELAMFSPIDPHLHGGNGGDEDPSSLSCLDIQQFGEMCETWFGANASAAREQSLSLLCNSIFPPTLTAFYRTAQELQHIGEELVSFQLPNTEIEDRKKIVKGLMSNYYSHNYAITAEELADIGLNIIRNLEVENLAWQISKVIQNNVGGAIRSKIDTPWFDVLIATKSSFVARQQIKNGLVPKWIEGTPR